MNKSMNELMSDCRTAPATPGLLTISNEPIAIFQVGMYMFVAILGLLLIIARRFCKKTFIVNDFMSFITL